MERDVLALSKPLASSPNQRSSIHHAIVLGGRVSHLKPEHYSWGDLPQAIPEEEIWCKHQRRKYPSQNSPCVCVIFAKTEGDIISGKDCCPRVGTHVQSAYKNPPKQKAAMPMRTTNCTIIARSESTMTLFLNVTNARLERRVSRRP